MVMRKPVSHLYEFGSFSLNVAERLLTCEGKTIQLAPKVFDTLQVLVENSGHLLEKEVLLEKLWPDTVVEESNLTTYISQLRKALGENGNSQSFIETVPRRGYRFVAEVREIHSDYDEILIHERTDTKIVVEEEFEFPLASTPQPVVSDQHFSENLISDQPPPQAVAKPWLQRKTYVIPIIILFTLGLIGTAFLAGKRFFFAKNSSPFQDISIGRLTTNGRVPVAAISPDGKYVSYIVREAAN